MILNNIIMNKKHVIKNLEPVRYFDTCMAAYISLFNRLTESVNPSTIYCGLKVYDSL